MIQAPFDLHLFKPSILILELLQPIDIGCFHAVMVDFQL